MVSLVDDEIRITTKRQALKRVRTDDQALQRREHIIIRGAQTGSDYVAGVYRKKGAPGRTGIVDVSEALAAAERGGARIVLDQSLTLVRSSRSHSNQRGNLFTLLNRDIPTLG